MKAKKIDEILEDLQFNVSEEPTTKLSEEELNEAGDDALTRFMDIYVVPPDDIEE